MIAAIQLMLWWSMWSAGLASPPLFASYNWIALFGLSFVGVPLGISAMPSVHVAMATWIALVIRSAAPRFAWLGWTYVGMIWLGSVHLGWHYVLDGLAGVMGAAAIWQIVPQLQFVRPLNPAQV